MAVGAIIKSRSVNLTRIATVMDSDAKIDSRIRRLKRFICQTQICKAALARFILKVLGLTDEPLNLILDRTNWTFGKNAPINILVLAVEYKNKAVPLMWFMLGKHGNSSQQERMDLLQIMIDTFGKNRIYTLTADREFIGKKWFKWLIDNNIPIDIRIKSDTRVVKDGRTYKAWELFEGTKSKGRKVIKGWVQVYGCEVRLSGGPNKSKNAEDKWCIIASTSLPHTAHKRYKKRWKIEQMFKDFKKSGFDLEATHITKPERLSQFFVLVGMAFIWVMKTGMEVAKKKLVAIKKLKHNRPRKSIFRLGLDTLQEASWKRLTKLLNWSVNLLSPT